MVHVYWSFEEMNNPSRADFYLMQIDTSVKRVLASRPSRIKLEHSRLKFQTEAPKAPSGQLAKNITDLAKGQWIGWAGGFHRKPGEANPPEFIEAAKRRRQHKPRKR